MKVSRKLGFAKMKRVIMSIIKEKMNLLLIKRLQKEILNYSDVISGSS